ncbi:oxysterol-binding protein-related protein 3-like isoform X2 [Limulus polyphemus]|uniref:Oxysterol-binding protein n=1 Tax=Limulus polyphemus TaxID=6850 RepID=A0ABM1T1S2_LIMPO|nr:oxysterol-binding protein-related protein 3-like isoform X2 [Limulus polyphemus]
MASSLRHIATEPDDLSEKANQNIFGDQRQIWEKSQIYTSDSDLSVGTGSLSHVSRQSSSVVKSRSALTLAIPNSNGPGNICVAPTESDSTEKTISRKSRKSRGSEWEILQGLRSGQKWEAKPEKLEGYLLKRRKWPLKGWHKRYFCLDKGILSHSKSTSDMSRGKLHGCVDIGLSVVSTKSRGRRIDIDAEEFIYHLKVKKRSQFQQWIEQLREHRLYRQYEIAYGSKEAPKITTPVEEVPTFDPVIGLITGDTPARSSVGRENSRHMRSPVSQQNRVAAWILDSAAIEQGNKDLSSLKDKLFQLSAMLQQLEGLSNTYTLPNVDTTSLKKERKRFYLKKNKKNKQVSETSDKGKEDQKIGHSKQQPVEIVVSQETQDGTTPKDVCDVGEKRDRAMTTSSLPIKDMVHLSSSQPSLSNLDDTLRPLSVPDSSSVYTSSLGDSSSSSQTSLYRCQEEFLALAKDVHDGLRTVNRSLHTERERMKQLLESEGIPSCSNSGTLITNLRNSLAQAVQQNTELRTRLQRIQVEADVTTLPLLIGSPVIDFSEEPTLVQQPIHQSSSYENFSVLSTSEYFDASEKLSICTTSSEESLSDEESFCSEVSDEGTEYTPVPSVTETPGSQPCDTGRRSKLPAPKPDTGDISLWNLLCKNIGKDLSKVSMPVTLNEPLNILQRMCEELEYNELLEKADETEDAFERMVYIAAFAVSAYSSSYYRAGHKPFNPLLGETYECVREDKGFRFVSEQVSHHPPVSACHAESKHYTFWQDMRVKSKFWGKSMEIIPVGTVHVHLTKRNNHYSWNKVTTCVHNLFSGQRWVDQYGELIISDSTGEASCKLTFVKASYWSSKRHEIHGSVTDRFGNVVHKLFGRWTEAFYCGSPPNVRCIWRPGAMPEDYELYYGFTQFAIELNELDSDIANFLPPTDTRFRPDQRLLEEGNVSAAESAKMQLEQSQRERRKKREEEGIEYIPMWFSRKDEDEERKEEWTFNNSYWELRNKPGFAIMSFPEKLW